MAKKKLPIQATGSRSDVSDTKAKKSSTASTDPVSTALTSSKSVGRPSRASNSKAIADEQKKEPHSLAKKPKVAKKASTTAKKGGKSAKNDSVHAKVGTAAPPSSPLTNLGLMHPHMPATGAVPPDGGIAITVMDILLPTTNAQIAARPSNREYIQLLQANCFSYHSLPTNEQAWLLNNICHFLTVVRNRRLLNFHPFYGWRVLAEPLPFLVAELNLDTFKRAAFRIHPLWLLGEHDPDNYHKGSPFLHRKVNGLWKRTSIEDVRVILQGEGLKNLLLLPEGMDFDLDATSQK